MNKMLLGAMKSFATEMTLCLERLWRIRNSAERFWSACSRERCDEEPELALDDGTVKIFYNCCYDGEDIPDDLRKFYDYVENGNVNSELTKRIDEVVVKCRKNEIWRSQYMKELVVLQDARDEGREEGRRSVIEDMLRRGKTVEEIVEFCGYPVELVKEVEERMLTTA